MTMIMALTTTCYNLLRLDSEHLHVPTSSSPRAETRSNHLPFDVRAAFAAKTDAMIGDTTS